MSTTRALTLSIAPKALKRFVDDSHARFKTGKQLLQFLDILNSQDPSIQYTTEFKEEKKRQCIFLDVTSANTGNNSYNFKIFRKTSRSNAQTEPNSEYHHISLWEYSKVFFYKYTKYALKNIPKTK